MQCLGLETQIYFKELNFKSQYQYSRAEETQMRRIIGLSLTRDKLTSNLLMLAPGSGFAFAFIETNIGAKNQAKKEIFNKHWRYSIEKQQSTKRRVNLRRSQKIIRATLVSVTQLSYE